MNSSWKQKYLVGESRPRMLALNLPSKFIVGRVSYVASVPLLQSPNVGHPFVNWKYGVQIDRPFVLAYTAVHAAVVCFAGPCCWKIRRTHKWVIQTSELSGHIRVFSDQTEKLFRELDIPDKQSLRIYQLCTSIALCLIDTDTICKHSLPMLGAPASNLPVSRGMRGWR